MTVERIRNGYEARVIEWGEYFACIQRIPAGTEVRAHEGNCECSQWGCVVSGKLRVVYQDGSEAVVSAGEVYSARSMNRFEALEDTKTVEFSPAAAHRQHLKPD
jgi:hypothetical protein